eukprot:1155106-Pelagomonas_calceolata.AAC.10
MIHDHRNVSRGSGSYGGLALHVARSLMGDLQLGEKGLRGEAGIKGRRLLFSFIPLFFAEFNWVSNQSSWLCPLQFMPGAAISADRSAVLYAEGRKTVAF